MDLGYQNFTGQYNLPMQTLSNVGSLTAALGPMAGGYGYAGGAPTSNTNFNPASGNIPNIGGPQQGGGGPQRPPGGGGGRGGGQQQFQSYPQGGGQGGGQGGPMTQGPGSMPRPDDYMGPRRGQGGGQPQRRGWSSSGRSDYFGGRQGGGQPQDTSYQQYGTPRIRRPGMPTVPRTPNTIPTQTGPIGGMEYQGGGQQQLTPHQLKGGTPQGTLGGGQQQPFWAPPIGADNPNYRSGGQPMPPLDFTPSNKYKELQNGQGGGQPQPMQTDQAWNPRGGGVSGRERRNQGHMRAANGGAIRNTGMASLLPYRRRR